MDYIFYNYNTNVRCLSFLLSLCSGALLLLLVPSCSTAPKQPSTVAASVPNSSPGSPQTQSSGSLSPTNTPIHRRTAIPLERNQRSFFVRAVFNGKFSAKLLLDTGAAYLTIHEDMARALGVNLTLAEPVACILADSSQAQAHRSRLAQVQLGDAVLRNVPVLVMPTRPSASHDGLLGMSFLENFVVELNAEESLLWLSARNTTPVPSSFLVAATPTTSGRGCDIGWLP